MISKQKNVYDRDTSYQHPTRMLLRRSIQHFKFYTEPRTTKFCKYSIIERQNFATIPSNIALHGSMVAFISDMQLHLFHLQLPYRLHLNATVYLCLFYPQLHLIFMPRGTTVSISYPQVHYISLSYPLFSLSNVLNPI